MGKGCKKYDGKNAQTTGKKDLGFVPAAPQIDVLVQLQGREVGGCPSPGDSARCRSTLWESSDGAGVVCLAKGLPSAKIQRRGYLAAVLALGAK